VIEARGGLGFTTETSQRLVGVALVSQNAFQGDNASGMRFPRPVNHTHSSPRDFVENLVLANAPVSVPGSYPRERFLERFRFQGHGVVIESAEEKAIQTETVGETRP
jgi:hypothetical protein